MLNNLDQKLCPKCLTVATRNDDFGFHKCPACENTWAYDKDDPDYDELVAALCPFHDQGSCSNNMRTYPKCEDCPNRNLN